MDDIYLQKIRSGNSDAFSYFVRTYKDSAFGIAISVLKNKNDAEDAVQEAFIKAYKGISSFKGEAKFSTWLFRIVVNEAYKKIETEKKYMANEALEIYENELRVEIPSLEKEEMKFYINETFKKLSPDFSLVLQLFYIKEYRIEEICEITSWTLAKVKTSLHRARNQFYNQLLKLLKHELNSLRFIDN